MFCFARDLALKNYHRLTCILGNALAVASMPQNKNEDPEIIEYYHSLREHILECYSCVIHCLKDNNQMEHFSENAQALLEFITIISNNEYDPGYEQCADCLGIIGDLCDAYGSNIKGVLNEKALTYLVRKLRSSGNKKYETIIEWSISVNYFLFLDYS